MSSGVKPNAKVGILYQNDDFGRDFLGPFKKVLADAGGTAKVIMEQTYDLTEPTVDSQLINLSKSGADVFYNISTGKASSQSIRKVAELGWKPLHLLSAGSTGRSILSAAGLENCYRHRRDPLRQGSRRAALREGSGRDGVRGTAQEISAQCRSG